VAVVLIWRYKEPPLEIAARYIVCCGKSMGSRGEETPVIPDEPDAPDAGYALQGLGVHGWRRVRRVD
jgi:hypothetical protein